MCSHGGCTDKVLVCTGRGFRAVGEMEGILSRDNPEGCNVDSITGVFSQYMQYYRSIVSWFDKKYILYTTPHTQTQQKSHI